MALAPLKGRQDRYTRTMSRMAYMVCSLVFQPWLFPIIPACLSYGALEYSYTSHVYQLDSADDGCPWSLGVLVI